MKRLIRKTITISIFTDGTFTNRQFTVTKPFLFAFLALLLAGLALAGTLFVDHHRLRRAVTDPELLKLQISRQQKRLAAYAEQIGSLDNKMSRMTTRMQTLQELENKIRKIARIKPSAGEENLFGVGGSKADSAKESARSLSGEKASAAGCPETRNELTHKYAVSAPEKLAFILRESDVSLNPISSLPASLPVNGAIIKKFEMYESHLTGNRELHKGLAIKTDPMVPVKTPACGIVSYHKREANGNVVMIDHGHGFTTRYTYLTKLSKKTGDRIHEGEIIGFLPESNTASEDKQQLNYELFFNGIQVNPETFISQCPFLL